MIVGRTRRSDRFDRFGFELLFFHSNRIYIPPTSEHGSAVRLSRVIVSIKIECETILLKLKTHDLKSM